MRPAILRIQPTPMRGLMGLWWLLWAPAVVSVWSPAVVPVWADELTPIVAPSEELVRALALDPFYQKCILAHGLPILASDKVSDHALGEAAFLADQMLDGRDDLRQAIVRGGGRIVVMAPGEYTTDVPEHRKLEPAGYWNRRARGLGGTPEIPVTSCGEENLLELSGDPYHGENILIHEFAHGIHLLGLNAIDKTFEPRLRDAFVKAKQEGLWKGTYAAGNYTEYWAEGVQSWFRCNRTRDKSHNDIDTREKLKSYDPRLAALLEQVFGDKPWRYVAPQKRPLPAHLAGFDRSQSPRFAWPPGLDDVYKAHRAKIEVERAAAEKPAAAPDNAAPSDPKNQSQEP